MPSMGELEREIVNLRREYQVLKEIEAIKQLKARYVRCLDCRLWDDLADCFTEDASTSYSGGRFSQLGRDNIIKFLKESLDGISMHQVHQPEIEITSETTAVGRWALEDYLITSTNTGVQGAHFYRDEYVKIDGNWRIKSTGYDTVFRQIWDRNETKSLKVTHRLIK